MTLLVGISPSAIGSYAHIEAIERHVDQSGISPSDAAQVTNFRQGGIRVPESDVRPSGIFGSIRFPWQTTPPPPSSGEGTTTETPPPDERNFFERALDTIRVPSSVADFTGSQQGVKTQTINPASPVTLAIAGAAALGAYLVFRS